jgi:hypothetical protein
MVALLSRIPSLGFLARAITLTLIAVPLVRLATAIGSNITDIPLPAALALLTFFGMLIAATLVVVRRLFRTVP